MKNFPKKFQDLLKDETRAFAFLGTTMPNGSPQVTPLWFNVDGDFILINSAQGRQKDLNMRARPNVALAIVDPKDPYRYFQIRGKVVKVTEEGGDAHIHALSHKYRGRDYTLVKGQVRVIYKIQPKKFSSMG